MVAYRRTDGPVPAQVQRVRCSLADDTPGLAPQTAVPAADRRSPLMSLAGNGTQAPAQKSPWSLPQQEAGTAAQRAQGWGPSAAAAALACPVCCRSILGSLQAHRPIRDPVLTKTSQFEGECAAARWSCADMRQKHNQDDAHVCMVPLGQARVLRMSRMAVASTLGAGTAPL